jgi:hypothetical protein
MTVLSVYGYDAEDHADSAVFKFIKEKSLMDDDKAITKDVANAYMSSFLPAEYEGKQIKMRSKL